MRPVRFRFLLLVASVACGVWVASADADRAYHAAHLALAPVGSAPLTSGFVENIHANGPNIYAHEIYQLNGAEPNTSYQVVLSIWTGNTSCSGEPTLQLPTATLTTNSGGNGLSDVVFTPEDAGGLRGSTVSAMWTLSSGATATYATECEVITLD
jgi:hypothetical protein